MTRYWMAVASKEHVEKGVLGGFAQVCHGKAGPLKQMREGDWIVYYSPKVEFQAKEPCQLFTAIGKVQKGDPYPFVMSEDFIPWRRDVSFFPSNEVSIKQLLEDLSFIHDKKSWGYPFRRGCFEIPPSDFRLIAEAMKVVEV